MNNFISYNNKEIKEGQILLNEINALVDNAQEIEKKYFLPISNDQEEEAQNINEEKTKNFSNEKKLLERQYRGLKYILNCIEKNYNLNSISKDLYEESTISNKQVEKINEEISNKIYNLYITKNFNSCYNLWEKYDFHILIGFSPERSFDILKYLNKIRDRYERRKNALESLNRLNVNLSKVENNNQNNQSIVYSNIINNSNSKNINNSQDYSLEIIKMHKEMNNESLFKGFSKEILFIYKVIKNMPPFEQPDYDMIIKNCELLITRLTQSNKNENIKYDWEIKLKEVYNNFKNLNVKREELLKEAFLKKGYDIGVEKFLEIFDY